MKFLMFGTGKIANEIMNDIEISRPQIEITGFIDNNETKYNQLFHGIKVYSPRQAFKLNYDYICVLIGNRDKYRDVYNQLVYGYGIDKSKIVDSMYLLKQIMIEKYKDDTRPFVQDTLSFWKTHDISFMNQFQYAEASYEKVFWDTDNNMPYIVLENKRLYYPKNYSDFVIRNNEMFVISYRQTEQHEKSPHRYLMGDIEIHEGDVVVDAGAREGDFALPYIDTIKKLYLFECDSDWVEALQMTYHDYKDKVVIVPKMLTDHENENMTTLDNVLSGEKINFLKMDIEGAEVSALQAASETLNSINIRCAICSYHKSTDQRDIISLLKEKGFNCSVSNGYIVFVNDPHIFRDLDFRKGIVYAVK